MTKGFTHESTYNESQEWYTPRYIFEALGIKFDLDPCGAGMVQTWVPAINYYTHLDDGLQRNWYGNVWMNPPYGSDTPLWMNKLKEHGQGIALVFSRCDTKWFHEVAPFADAICFIKGRVKFVPAQFAQAYADKLYEPKGGCGAGSMLIAFGVNNAEILHNARLGLTLDV